MNQQSINQMSGIMETKQVETTVEETVKYIDKEFLIIIDKKAL
jgi:hypothetical protein